MAASRAGDGWRVRASPGSLDDSVPCEVSDFRYSQGGAKHTLSAMVTDRPGGSAGGWAAILQGIIASAVVTPQEPSTSTQRPRHASTASATTHSLPSSPWDDTEGPAPPRAASQRPNVAMPLGHEHLLSPSWPWRVDSLRHSAPVRRAPKGLKRQRGAKCS